MIYIVEADHESWGREHSAHSTMEKATAAAEKLVAENPSPHWEHPSATQWLTRRGMTIRIIELVIDA